MSNWSICLNFYTETRIVCSGLLGMGKENGAHTCFQ